MIFFTMNPNLNFFGGRWGLGDGARVSEFFNKASKSKRIFLGGEGMGEGVGEGVLGVG